MIEMRVQSSWRSFPTIMILSLAPLTLVAVNMLLYSQISSKNASALPRSHPRDLGVICNSLVTFKSGKDSCFFMGLWIQWEQV